ncbi:MAG: HEAT repeat domain-containing protein [Opitutaceae bacterium]
MFNSFKSRSVFSILLLSLGRVLFGLDATLVEQMLDYYPPTPHWALALAEHTPIGAELPELPSIHHAPVDSAPVATHVDYWRLSRSWSDGHEPSSVVRQKVLKAVLETPALLPSALKVLPQNKAAAIQVEKILGSIPQSGSDAASDLHDVRAWIYENSGILQDEVMADAVRSLDNKYGWAGSRSMVTLWRVDPDAATQVCLRMTKSGEWKQRVAGAKFLLEHGNTEEDWRALLVEVAGDSECTENIRNEASRVLLRQDASVRNEWMLATMQFADEWYRNGFENIVKEDPDYWIPKLIPFVDGPNRLAHERAVGLLIKFNIERARVDALRPLLPWLSNPNWAKGKMGRLRLVQSLDRISLPESIDGLIYVIENDSDEWLCRGAAESLASYNVREALPALKAAYGRLGQYQVFEVIDQMGGYTTAEQLAFIEAYFRKISEEDRSKFYQDPLAEWIDDVSGDYYISALQRAPREALFQALIERAQTVEKSDPELGKFLNAVVLNSFLASESEFLSNSLRAGKVSSVQIIAALERCESEDWNSYLFVPLAQMPGEIGGFATVLSRDPNLVSEVLLGDDPKAQAAVFAASRIIGDVLPLDAIANALELPAIGILRDAALAYLESSQDGPTRQYYTEIRDRFIREGLLEDRLFDDDLYIERLVELLLSELRHRFGIEQTPVEVYGLLSSGTWGGVGQRYLLVFPEQCLAVQDFDGGRMGFAKVSDVQFKSFQIYINDYRIDSLPPLTLNILDGIQYNYFHYDGVTLRSVFMNNPPANSYGAADYAEADPALKGIVLYACLMRNFFDLFEGLDFNLSYGSQLAILLSREQGKVQNVWASGDDLRVLIKHSKDVLYWQGLDSKTGEFTGEVPEPSACAMSSMTADMHEEFKYSDYYLRHPSQVRSNEVYIRSGTFRGELGIWLCQLGLEPELLAAGRFLGEFVSSDGKWCAVPKALGRSWAEPNAVVLFNLETREQFTVDIEPADELNVVCYLPSHSKFLVYRSRDPVAPGVVPKVGPEYPEYYLFDPESGESSIVHGDFDLLTSHRSLRPLQPVAGADGDIVWGAKTQYGLSGGLMTVVGHYDRHGFKFEPLIDVPGYVFSSTDIWVDEAQGILYIVLNEDLVAMALEASVK